MTPCTDTPKGGWTFDTLLRHVLTIVSEQVQRLGAIMDERDKRYDQRFEASQKGIETALSAVKEASMLAQQAADRAVAKAEAASEKRFEGVNEFRNTLADQQRTLMPRSEAEIRFNELAMRVGALNDLLTAQGGARSGAKEGWGYAVGIFGLLLALGALTLRVAGH